MKAFVNETDILISYLAHPRYGGIRSAAEFIGRAEYKSNSGGLPYAENRAAITLRNLSRIWYLHL